MDNVLNPDIMQGTMTFTEAGAAKASALLAAQNKSDGAIRVFVKSGGCSGYSYGMAIDEKTL